MAERKSYNKDALRGMPVDDKEWQADMAKVGIVIPDDMLYTPDGPRYALRQIRERNIQTQMQELGIDEKEARKQAEPLFKAAVQGYDKLLKQ